MFEKLEAWKARYEALSEKIAKPEVIANQEQWRKLMKEHAELEEVVHKYEQYLSKCLEMEDLEE